MPKRIDVKAALAKVTGKFPQLKKKTTLLPLGFLLLVVLLGFFLIRNKSLLVVAKVGNTFISRGELDKTLVTKYGSQTLEELITITLVKNELAKQNVTVSEAEVAAKVKEIEASLGGASLDDALKSQGSNLQDFREQLNIRLRAEKLLSGTIVVSDDEIKSFITQYGSQLQAKDAEGQKQETEKELKNEKLQQAITDWISNLKTSTKVEKYL